MENYANVDTANDDSGNDNGVNGDTSNADAAHDDAADDVGHGEAGDNNDGGVGHGDDVDVDDGVIPMLEPLSIVNEEPTLADLSTDATAAAYYVRTFTAFLVGSYIGSPFISPISAFSTHCLLLDPCSID